MMSETRTLLVYLDQCVLSRFVPSPDEAWHGILDTVLVGSATGKIICPYSLEHLIESAPMNSPKATAADILLRNLSSGWSLRIEPELVAAEINSIIRNKPLTWDDVLEPIPFKQLADGEVQNFLAQKKLELDKFNERTVVHANKFNALLRNTCKSKRSLLVSLVDHIARKRGDELKETVETALANGGVTVKERQDLPNVPTWTSSVIYILVSRHGFTSADMEALASTLEPCGLLFLPFFQIKAALEAYLWWSRRKVEPRDQYDITRIACALPFVDALITDGGVAHRLRDTSMDKLFGTVVFSTKAAERENILGWLQKAIR